MAYRTVDMMAMELGIEPMYAEKAEKMKCAINKHFWNDEHGKYRYIIDKFGGCDYDEEMGNSFAVIFGIADGEKAEKVLKNQHITPYGIPCVYPSFPRYKGGFGRHSGTVWPHIQAFWAYAAIEHGDTAAFDKEFNMLTDVSVRDGFFAEISSRNRGDIRRTSGARQVRDCTLGFREKANMECDRIPEYALLGNRRNEV